MSFSLDKLGNRYPSDAERLILQHAIERDEKRLEPLRTEISATEEQHQSAKAALEDAKKLLDDASLRYRAISSVKEATSKALEIVEGTDLKEDEQDLLAEAPSTGSSHLAIANRILKQQEKVTKPLRDRLAALEMAESKADAAVEVEKEAHNIAEMRLFGLEDDLKMYRDQVVAIESAILARKRRFSAIWKLTAEIWLQIFKFVVSFPPFYNSSTRPPRAVICPAHSLNQVCQLWSGVITDTSTLRGYICITTLALTKKNQAFVKKCLENLQQISFLIIQTRVGLVSQAQVLVDMFQGWIIDETEISASKDSIEAAQHLITHLPTPRRLFVSNGDTSMDKKDVWWLTARPMDHKRVKKVVLNNFLVFSGSSIPPWSFVQDVHVEFTRPYRATYVFGATFANMTKLFMTGNPGPRSNKDPNTMFIFPRLASISGSVVGLANTFDAQCQLPTLRDLTTWIDSNKTAEMLQWKAFVQRHRNPDLNHVQILDMTSPNLIVQYVMELHGLPNGLPVLTLCGRTVDPVCLAFKDQRIMFAVQTLVISNYAGDGSAVFDFVKACSDMPNSQIIPQVIWVDCSHVTPAMRAAVHGISRWNEVASASQPAAQAG